MRRAVQPAEQDIYGYKSITAGIFAELENWPNISLFSSSVLAGLVCSVIDNNNRNRSIYNINNLANI